MNDEQTNFSVGSSGKQSKLNFIAVAVRPFRCDGAYENFEKHFDYFYFKKIPFCFALRFIIIKRTEQWKMFFFRLFFCI